MKVKENKIAGGLLITASGYFTFSVTNSAGYGLVVEANSLDFESAENKNTFTNNTNGNVLVKP